MRAQAEGRLLFTRGSHIAVAVVVVLAIVSIFAFNNWMGSKPVEVTLNGDQVTISGAERSVAAFWTTTWFR